MLMQVAAHCFVRIDVLINVLMADRGLLFQGEPARDLCRTPILTKLILNKRPGLRLNADGDMLELAFFSSVLCLLGAIATPASITREFARDGTGMDPNLGSNRKLSPVGFEAGVNLVSLLLGKLCVTDQCFFLTWSLKTAPILRQLAR
jgi:hypothetical protein